MSPFFATTFTKSIPGIFMLLSTLIIPFTQVVLTIPSIAYLSMTNPCIFSDRKLPNPRRIYLFSSGLFLYCLYYTLTIVTFLGNPEEVLMGIEVGVILSFFGLWTMTMILTSFVFGSSLEQFCQTISDTDYYSRQNIEELSKELYKLKNGLSPILFMLYSTKCILIINSSLNLATQNYEPIYTALWISLVLVTMWDLVYVTLIVGDTLAAYKGLSLKLR